MAFQYRAGFILEEVIEAKYGCAWGGWCSNPMTTSYGVSLWKTIWKIGIPSEGLFLSMLGTDPE